MKCFPIDAPATADAVTFVLLREGAPAYTGIAQLQGEGWQGQILDDSVPSGSYAARVFVSGSLQDEQHVVID